MISLIRRALNFLKNKGLKLFVKQIFISLSHRLGISIKIHPLARTRGLHKARKIFNNRELIYIEDGYWMLEPMPTKDELNEYYSNVYWGSWLDRDYGVKLRDFFHFNLNPFGKFPIYVKDIFSFHFSVFSISSIIE